ncbi:ABC transporter permease [Candidatus Bathyarchaeota archaeon]|jgi:ABC-2 type transport system permease protein|nr:ABC transporter permease [Candidatus Bathyarchaeota archaeon]MBT4319839.1 ABC transporter permease [Candidatus Bathyarchaeota archaeon]MBT4425212.1 ABC transporter permease [Candidatus Bathyarchaeota archaeon]MBT5641947.1 ABC transporter permease [Candidatus Bathyarchaeota archaeon]MBT6604366.1 ABC transporter permease [Candidatus Bathyarchaeota archaeon]
MNFQRVRALTVKEILRVLREPANLFMLIMLPLVMTLVFGIAFGGIGGGDIKYGVAIVDQDASSWSGELVSGLNISGVLVPQFFEDSTSGKDALSQGKVSAVLVIPNGFGSSVDGFKSNPVEEASWTVTTLELSIDQGSMVAGSVVPSLVQQALTVTLYGVEALSPPSPVVIGSPVLVESVKVTQFDNMMPGMFSYAVIFVTMIVSQVFTEERQQGLLKRIAFTPTTAADIFAAQITANTITGVFQITVVLGSSYLMGFRPMGGLAGIGLAYLMSLLLVLCNVGFGLITATLAKSSGSASGLAFLFILPQMMLGSFIPGIPEGLSRLVPSTYVTQTLTNVFLRGASSTSDTSLQNLGILGVYSLVVIVVGIVLYNKYGNR